MNEIRLPTNPDSAPVPGFLVELAPWPRVFVGNLGDLLRPGSRSPVGPPHELHSATASFWPDVFVPRGLPWGRFAESYGLHLLALVTLVALSRFLNLHPPLAPRPSFDRAPVIYYQPAEYLPPLDTRRSHNATPQKADPEFSRQSIISVPREADNHAQTIVTPPNIKLQRDVLLPNIVAWSERPQLPIAPAPVLPASMVTRMAPQFENSVVAPPPEVRAPPTTAFQAPQPAVVEPPPSVNDASTRRLGEINIGPSPVIAPAPQLAVGEQRAIPGAASATGNAPQVVPPPPSLSGSGASSGGGRIIALSLHPTIGAPPDPPQGNRRGNFAATPEGRVGASGNPGSSSGAGSDGSNGHGNGSASGRGGGSGKNGSSGLPSGLYIGSAGPKTAAVTGDPAPKSVAPAVNPKLIASIPARRVTSAPAHPLQPASETKLSEAEREVFGSRKFYALTLNMPNLNSAGGSWVIRFAELKQNSNSGELSAPAATRKVDPAYPLELMRQNVAGTVILYGVIRADGTVGNVRVLQSVDDRLDQFASQAIAKWQFQPAAKNGAAIDVEATFQIPFHPGRHGF
jgi:TonB family protein